MGEIGNFDETIECYNKSLSIVSEYAEAWYNKGIALEKMGKFEEAKKACETALSLAREQKNTELEKSILENMKSLEEQDNN